MTEELFQGHRSKSSSSGSSNTGRLKILDDFQYIQVVHRISKGNQAPKA